MLHAIFIMQCLIVPFTSYSANWFLQCGSLSSFRRHFLFKHGSGSSAIFSAASQNYPLTSNTVYSPPPRPLPRSTFSRPAFTFNKPYRCCNWKCTALSATAITVTLALLLAYVIGKPLFLFYAELLPFLLCCHACFYTNTRCDLPVVFASGSFVNSGKRNAMLARGWIQCGALNNFLLC